MNAAAKDVLVRAGKTAVQTFLPAAATLYSHLVVTHTPPPTATVEAGALAAAAGAVSVLWNGSAALLGARRARKLNELAAAIDAAVAARLASPAPAASSSETPTP